MARMCKMPWPSILLFLFVALSVAGQESVELFTLHDSNLALSSTAPSLAVALPNQQLKDVSTSILNAENWTRTHIFPHYPAINITTIFAGHNLLCEKGKEHNFSLVLPTLKNIHYTLTRWGLQKEIKVSASFSSSCLHLDSGTFRDNIAESHIKPLLSFLQEIDSIYLVNPPSIFPSRHHEALISLQSHSQALKNLGFFNLTKMKFIINNPNEAKSTGRKLSSTRLFPFSPSGSPTGSPDPISSPTTPFPPLIGMIPSPPLINPASPPFGLDLPPCNPSHGGPTAAPPPVTGVMSELWCVAKPNVPQETLQEALDYACGDGGADCEAIRPQGSCYYPNTVVAHASFAFNSYWQKTKSNGGTCGFGGTAMLISSDPSYSHCRFILT